MFGNVHLHKLPCFHHLSLSSNLRPPCFNNRQFCCIISFPIQLSPPSQRWVFSCKKNTLPANEHFTNTTENDGIFWWAFRHSQRMEFHFMVRLPVPINFQGTRLRDGKSTPKKTLVIVFQSHHFLSTRPPTQISYGAPINGPK